MMKPDLERALRIRLLREQGLSYREIEARTGLAQHTITNVLHRWRTGSYAEAESAASFPCGHRRTAANTYVTKKVEPCCRTCRRGAAIAKLQAKKQKGGLNGSLQTGKRD